MWKDGLVGAEMKGLMEVCEEDFTTLQRMRRNNEIPTFKYFVKRDESGNVYYYVCSTMKKAVDKLWE